MGEPQYQLAHEQQEPRSALPKLRASGHGKGGLILVGGDPNDARLVGHRRGVALAIAFFIALGVPTAIEHEHMFLTESVFCKLLVTCARACYLLPQPKGES